ncbi:hypothetical protein JVX90_13295 [Gordonia sp. PDNC005]|uniref:hypothetical protein n=1 Tax=unclassified Gordonia (in: high G+C Gram-positive bacteria) TaxID=2657482 RepID=UPI0019629D69|nr:hypothetical protein [Gordonia sp. PDNC005]QRY61392.1 hypothetical protein JVX90_13295 [Gordonia sp. PDNC005]
MTATVNAPDLPVLLPGVPVLARRDSCVQVGCDPGSAILIDVDRDVDTRTVATLLQSLRQPTDYRSIARTVRAIGLDARTFRSILDRLVAAGQAARPDGPPTLTVPVHILGRGDVARELTKSLTDADMTVDEVPTTGLIVIADQPVPDPRLTRLLMAARLPHLPVHLRDGIGVVGPLVLPGTSSCLRCADLHRTDFDPQWPIVAASLLDLIGHAAPAVLRATVAIAHGQIDEITTMLTSSSRARPSLVERSLEYSSGPSRLEAHSRPVHPRCGCGADPITQV